MRKRIGEFLVDKGVLDPSQVEQVLKHGKETGLRFGDAAVDLGVITREDLVEVFGPSYAVDFFHLDPRYFPKVTQDLLPVDELLRLGVLPLGFKTETKLFRTRKILNLGMLDPSRQDVVKEVVRAAIAKLGAKEVHDVKVFLILGDQFLGVMEQVYGRTEAEIKSIDPTQIDGTLAMFLENAR